MQILDRYQVDCPDCKEQIILKPDSFCKLFDQRQGFLHCPHTECNSFLYAEIINNDVKLESVRPIKE